MSDTILGGIEGDLIDGDVGNDTLFGGADTEWSGWPEPDTIFGVMRPDGFIPGGLRRCLSIAGTSDLSPQVQPDTETIIYDGKLWRIVHLDPVEFIDNGKARRLVEVEEV